MQFTDIIFALFLSTVFCLYWFPFRGRTGWQNMLLLAASYVFYGWWDWHFLGLIFLTSLTTFLTAQYARSRYGKVLTISNIVLNLGILICFKYLGFFSENLGRLLSLFGIGLDWFTIEILVPVGISFYTFQAIAYSIDVYKGRVEACRNPLVFFTFISYFPQLVAGPIERASQLLPQIDGRRQWNRQQASSGMRMIMFGLMKKVCIADILAIYVDRIFSATELTPIMVLSGGILFSLEIYCDFSAYSEIARGVSRLLGIELMVNFKFPYFSRNIPEFWRRWHISLMEWFRDYLYIPLGGNRKGKMRTAFNTLIIFALSGLWHGAAWNFVLWGLYWGAFSVAAKFLLGQKIPKGDISFGCLPSMIATFGVASFGFYLFRCSGEAQILSGLKALWLYTSVFAGIWAFSWLLVRYVLFRKTIIIISTAAIAGIIGYIAVSEWIYLLKFWWLIPGIMVLALEWEARNSAYPLQSVSPYTWKRMMLYAACVFFIAISEPTEMTFIYFQF
ncbi:MAG: MBOAT family protein [Muribaculaceae bacterium]|nr:MBOAT family protein [Muribaculaceae bacterium]